MSSRDVNKILLLRETAADFPRLCGDFFRKTNAH